MGRKTIRQALVLLTLLALLAPAITRADTDPETARTRAAAGIEALQGWYVRGTGLYDTTAWWNSANALHAVIDFSARTGSTAYLDEIENTFQAHEAGQFRNHFYDDAGWWALTWIAAYDLTGKQAYLEMAETIFADMLTGWDDICGGGVWWNRDREYKNAIPNELFLQVAARLYNRTRTADYLDWAKKTWTWFAGSGMINRLNLVNDGLRDCKNNGEITWTYNQGVILGGLVELHRATNDPALLTQAEAIADAAIRLLIDERSGILREPCELSFNCGNDGPQFKGIFIRNLWFLYEATQKPEYCAFILKNAESIWTKNRNAQNQFGLRWYGRFDRADAARHSSAQEALNAAIGCSAP